MRQLLGLCVALTVRHADGGYPASTEIDHDARTELAALLDRLRPQVQQVAAASAARVRRQQTVGRLSLDRLGIHAARILRGDHVPALRAGVG